GEDVMDFRRLDVDAAIGNGRDGHAGSYAKWSRDDIKTNHGSRKPEVKQMKEIVILGGARTPIGSFLGTLSSLPAPKLGSIAIKCALENSRVNAEDIQQVIMGNVLQAAVGQA